MEHQTNVNRHQHTHLTIPEHEIDAFPMSPTSPRLPATRVRKDPSAPANTAHAHTRCQSVLSPPVANLLEPGIRRPFDHQSSPLPQSSIENPSGILHLRGGIRRALARPSVLLCLLMTFDCGLARTPFFRRYDPRGSLNNGHALDKRDHRR
ncbi:hypothetical protein CSUI_000238 [Cystoisospora suis]|uniref:Uncharacterized protein n=1 Tax=Cystoisospora suis TaxID=483139 RepID=A0A2C6LET2_9APIC|nr:hypothetical protein CSUI_000238 [Cystoisospora suis]